MILISNLTLNIEDGSTIASTEIYGIDKKTYINIGSGSVFKLEWDVPSIPNDSVDRYVLVIKRYDPNLNLYYDIFNRNIGLVNEFYVDASLLPASLPAQYLLSIYVAAYSKLGSIITSNTVNPYVCKGSGTYVKTDAGYMKRALAFAKVPTTADATTVILNERTEEVAIQDEDGNLVQIQTTRLLSSPDWNIMQESYTKDATGTWRISDIKYEVLVDETGSIITDENDEPIYIL